MASRWPRRLPPRSGPMTLRRSRFNAVSIVLAVVALFGIIVVSGWHGSIIHYDVTSHASSPDHVYAPAKPADPDAPIHLIAHAMGQWVPIAGPLAIPVVAVIADRNWARVRTPFRGGIDPAALLRPPRR